VDQIMLAPPDGAQEAPLGNSEAGSFPASLDDGKGPERKGYSVRWLCHRYPLSPAAAKIISLEFGWLEAA
jgi:hypothetical protein